MSPKRSENVRRSPMSSCWPGKRSTPWVPRASRISANSRSVTRFTSMPWTVAPRMAPVGSMDSMRFLPEGIVACSLARPTHERNQRGHLLPVSAVGVAEFLREERLFDANLVGEAGGNQCKRDESAPLALCDRGTKDREQDACVDR